MFILESNDKELKCAKCIFASYSLVAVVVAAARFSYENSNAATPSTVKAVPILSRKFELERNIYDII